MLVKDSLFNNVSCQRAIEESFSSGRARFSYFYSGFSAVPEFRSVILTCMDCRILSESFGIFKPGKSIFIRTAGALFTPDVLRSLLIAIYELKVEFIAVVGHNDCGGKMSELKMKSLIKRIAENNNISEQETLKLLGKKSANEEFLGFIDTNSQIIKTVNEIKSHPLIPEYISVSGYIFDHSNGSISKVS